MGVVLVEFCQSCLFSCFPCLIYVFLSFFLGGVCDLLRFEWEGAGGGFDFWYCTVLYVRSIR